MIKIVDKGEIRKLTGWVSGIQKEQIPFATKVALNEIAKRAKVNIQGTMKQVFDRPTRYTLNSFYIDFATKQKLEATLKLKDQTSSGKGTPATRYLQPQVTGGGRSIKSTEKTLRRVGIRKRGQFIMPAKGAKLNKYGNIPGSEYVKITSALRAFSEVGFTANRARKRGTTYFVKFKGNKPIGVWKRTGKRSVKSVLAFVSKAPVYKERLPFHEVAEKTYDRHFGNEFEKAFDNAMRTAK